MQLMVVKLTGGGAIPKQRKVILIFFSLEGGICTCGEGNGTPLQYSCLENPMDGGAWWAAVHEVAKSWTRLSNFTLTFHFLALEMEMATHSSILAWRIPWTAAYQASLSMGFSRQEHWSGLPFPSPMQESEKSK